MVDGKILDTAGISGSNTKWGTYAPGPMRGLIESERNVEFLLILEGHVW